jgi:hypothetical protein
MIVPPNLRRRARWDPSATRPDDDRRNQAVAWHSTEAVSLAGRWNPVLCMAGPPVAAIPKVRLSGPTNASQDRDEFRYLSLSRRALAPLGQDACGEDYKFVSFVRYPL